MGTFLAALRKAKGMTQQEVADKLSVSNKTVSKWERDEGCPEIMMLPLIAELYSVTVDEILRGERITKPENPNSTDTKSEKQIKYLIDRATTKFKNLSIISIVSGIAGLLLAYTIGDILYDFNFLWVGLLISMLLSAASIIIIAIATNNLLSSFNNEDVITQDVFAESKKICIKNISIVIFITILILCGIILNVIYSGVSGGFVALPITCIIAGILTYFARSFLLKKFGITENQLPPEIIKYRKKHIKTTSIIIAVCIVISLILPFIVVAVDNLLSREITFSYLDGIDYPYENIEDATNDYNKIKDYIVNGKKLYKVINRSYNDNSYTLIVDEIVIEFEETEKGYKAVTQNIQTPYYEYKYFSTEEEMDKFEYENCWDADKSINPETIYSDIKFDDNTYTVYYTHKAPYDLSEVFDIFPVFIIGGACICVAVFLSSCGIYIKNKKKMM